MQVVVAVTVWPAAADTARNAKVAAAEDKACIVEYRLKDELE